MDTIANRKLIANHLKAERYDLGYDHATLDRCLLKEVGQHRQTSLQKCWNESDEKLRLQLLYRFPSSAREAHLLFSHDRRRILDTFEWVLNQGPFAGLGIDLGAGTGTMGRLLIASNMIEEIVLVEEAANLASIGQTFRNSDQINWICGNFNSDIPTWTQFTTLFSICGVEFLDQPEVPIEAELAIRDGQISKPALEWAHSASFGLLQYWRSVAAQDARLLFAGRIGTVVGAAAFISTAASAGWRFVNAASERLRSGDERFPVLTFRADAAHQWTSAEHLASWLPEN